MKKTTDPADTLLTSLNLDAFEPEERMELLLKLSDLVFRGSLLQLIEQMDEQTRADFSALTDSGASGEQVMAFLQERVPGADRAVAETIRELASDMGALDLPATV